MSPLSQHMTSYPIGTVPHAAVPTPFHEIFTRFLHCSRVHFGVLVVLDLCALCCAIYMPFCPTDMPDNIHTFFKRVEAPSKAQTTPKAKPPAGPLQRKGNRMCRNPHTVPTLFRTAPIRQLHRTPDAEVPEGESQKGQ